MDKNTNRFILVVVAVALLGFGYSVGYYAGKTAAVKKTPLKQTRLAGFQYINPLLECDSGDAAIGAQELQPFRHKLDALIKDQKKRNWASHISVYFRDMNNGLATGIDDREKFAPASLLKVPLMIAYLKWAESNPGLLMAKLTFQNMQDQSARQHIKPVQSLKQGSVYTVDELLYYMIAYSDNNAYFLLYANVDVPVLHRVYTDLGLAVPRVRNPKDYLTVSEYAAFFRILFNASYLNKELSEKALSYLAQVDYKDGMIAGLPEGVVAAQKFGEMTMGAQEEIKQVHDCGIVYYPEHPYLLCMMTRGESFEQLDDAIREISRHVYTEVDTQYKNARN